MKQTKSLLDLFEKNPQINDALLLYITEKIVQNKSIQVKHPDKVPKNQLDTKKMLLIKTNSK